MEALVAAARETTATCLLVFLIPASSYWNPFKDRFSQSSWIVVPASNRFFLKCLVCIVVSSSLSSQPLPTVLKSPAFLTLETLLIQICICHGTQPQSPCPLDFSRSIYLHFSWHLFTSYFILFLHQVKFLCWMLQEMVLCIGSQGTSIYT